MTSSPASDAPSWAANADERLDTSGLACPEPLMLLRNRVRALEAGTRVHVIATDPASVRDFERFCQFLGHRMAEREEEGPVLHFLIEKGGGSDPR